MRVNACGKDCAGCGEETTALCGIARCAEKKCFDKCAECRKNDDCKKLTQKDDMPILRREKLRYAAGRCVWAQENAKPLRIWLQVLAVLAVPRGIVLLLSFPVEALLPGGAQVMPTYFFALKTKLLVAAFHVLYGAVLLLLSRLQEKYRPAGLCILLSGAVTAVQPFLDGKMALALLAVYLLLCFAGEYWECAAHADTALGIDNTLAENWGHIWKWIVTGQIALIAAYPLMPYALVLTGMTMVVVAVVVPRIYRRKIVRLWWMGQRL